VKKLVLMAGCAVLLALPSAGQAQIQFGPQVAWGSDSDLGVGARIALGMPQIRPGVELHVGGDYFFFDCDSGFSEVDCSWIEVNANLHVPVPVSPTLNTYAGAGLNVARVKVSVDGFGDTFSASNTEIGLNVLGGLKFSAASFTPFVEASFTLGGGEQFVLRAGILLGGGSR
jgi:hypothetical protein